MVSLVKIEKKGTIDDSAFNTTTLFQTVVDMMYRFAIEIMYKYDYRPQTDQIICSMTMCTLSKLITSKRRYSMYGKNIIEPVYFDYGLYQLTTKEIFEPIANARVTIKILQSDNTPQLENQIILNFIRNQ